MTRISWGSPGSRTFETGVDRGVFYPQIGPGVPWNGLINVKEEPTGTDLPRKFIDGVPVRSPKSREGFAAVLQAYSSPVEFDEYEGFPGLSAGRRPKLFGLSYRTGLGNDIRGADHASKIHLVYNASAMATKSDFNTLGRDGVDAAPFSWAISTSPVDIPGVKPAAHLIVDTSIAYPDAIQALEDVIYGSAGTQARLPKPQELMDLFEQHAILTIIDHGDGTWSAIGPDSAVKMLDGETFQIDWPSVVYLDEDTYQVSSL